MFKKKSQSSTEFIIIAGFVLFFFTIFFLAIKGNMSEKIRERQDLAVKEIAITVQDEINLASSSSDGYYREFTVPNKVNGKDYDVNLIDELVYVNTTDGNYAIALPVQNVTGNIKKGNNIIKKEDGEVKLNV